MRIRDLHKAFGPTQALAGASAELWPGEVLAMLGENGSGKSTLVKVLAGVHHPDSGSVQLDGEELRLDNPSMAFEAGISTVFQEVLVTESRSILENIWLGQEGILRQKISDATKHRRASELLTRLLGSPRPLDAPIGFLSLSDRQTCCIVRALVRDPKILILDEATSALDVETRRRLFELLGELTEQGSSVIFISHRMDEIEEVGDRITVLRSGKTVTTVDRGKASVDDLVGHMTGAEQLVTAKPKRRAKASGEPVLTAKDVRLTRKSEPIDFAVRPGELVGLAGLEGHGQDAFIKALWGLWPAPGDIACAGSPVTSPTQAEKLGVAYVARERRAESLFASKSVLENFGVVTLDADSRSGFYSRRRTRARLAPYIKDLGIVLGDGDDNVMSLSGGNQQKVVIARWLAANPKVLLLNDPTRGVDLGAKRDLYRLLRDLSAKGVAIVMLSTEVDEHLELMDRVVVFREFSVGAELEGNNLTAEKLVGAFFGKEATK